MYSIAGEIGLLHPPPVLRTFPMENSTSACDLLLQNSFSARSALTIILDVPGHPVRSTIFDLPATFSDTLHASYAVSLSLDRLAVNLGGGNLPSIESE
jgi:hypothetical protein